MSGLAYPKFGFSTALNNALEVGVDATLDNAFGYRTFVNKSAEAQVGETRTWATGRFQKQGDKSWKPVQDHEQGHKFSDMGHRMRSDVINSLEKFHSYSSPEMRHIREQHRQMWADESKHISPEARLKGIEFAKRNASNHGKWHQQAQLQHGFGSTESAHAKFAHDEAMNDVDALERAHRKHTKDAEGQYRPRLGAWKVTDRHGISSDIVDDTDAKEAHRVFGGLLGDGAHLYHLPQSGTNKWVLHTPAAD